MVHPWNKCTKTSLEMTNMKHVKVTEMEEVPILAGNCSTLHKNKKGQASKELNCL
jgi:hypothetical protein